MAKKQELKMSEARVIIFLKNANLDNCFARQMMSKMAIDYGYLLRILQTMTEKGWVKKTVDHTRVIYSLTDAAPYKTALKVFGVSQPTITQAVRTVSREQPLAQPEPDEKQEFRDVTHESDDYPGYYRDVTHE